MTLFQNTQMQTSFAPDDKMQSVTQENNYRPILMTLQGCAPARAHP